MTTVCGRVCAALLTFTAITVAQNLAQAVAQDSDHEKATTASPPRLRFVFDHPDVQVTHYQIDVAADGAAHYESRIRGHEKGSSEDEVSRDFTVSPETRTKLFALAKAANNLDGDFNFSKHKIAFTGNKTIILTDAGGTHTTKIVWSENQQIMSLIEVFEGISGTLEEEPTLQRLRRFDRLGLNAELAKMERLANSGWLREINLISGVLKDIASDSSIMSLARRRAERLLKLASGASKET